MRRLIVAGFSAHLDCYLKYRPFLNLTRNDKCSEVHRTACVLRFCTAGTENILRCDKHFSQSRVRRVNCALLLTGLTTIRLFQQLFVKRVFSFNELHHLSCCLIASEGQTNKYGEGSGRIWGTSSLDCDDWGSTSKNSCFHVAA